MAKKIRKKKLSAQSDPTEVTVDEAADQSVEPSDVEPSEEELTEVTLPNDMDMEAAMEEDIAGDTEGVSRRNPDTPTGAAFTPTLGNVLAESYGAPRPMRSGAEEADWFNRFRERLAGGGGATVMHEAAPDPSELTQKDPDDPPEDEAETYSELE